jgi:hypothetical protein
LKKNDFRSEMKTPLMRKLSFSGMTQTSNETREKMILWTSSV